MESLPGVIEFFNSLIKPEDIVDTPGAKENLENILQSFLNKQIDLNQAKEMCKPYIKDAEQLRTVTEILTLVSQNSFPQQNQSPGQRHRSPSWTPDEDHKLSEAVAIHGVNNWGAVAQHVGNGRTRAQCSQHWNRVINPNISKTNWTSEEEEKLFALVGKYGTKQWTRVAAEMGNRTDVQCRFKYFYLAKKKQKSQEQMIPMLEPPTIGMPSMADIQMPPN